jgi:MFS family permease
MVAPAVAAPFMGLLGDRLPRRRVMVAADLSRVVLIALAAAIVYASGPLLLVYAILSVVSIAGTAFRPAQASLLPALARSPDELTACNAVSSTIQSATAFVGPAVGGVLVATTQPGTALLVSAAMFVWSALLIAGIGSRRASRPRPRERVRSGGSVRSSPRARGRSVIARWRCWSV